MIEIYNRRTHQIEEENPAGEKWIRRLYETKTGQFMLEVFLKYKWYSALSGFYCNSMFSKRMIKPFIEKQGILINEALQDVEDFTSFNDFFTRRLKDNARPFADFPALTSPGDGRIQVFNHIVPERLPQIKGGTYRLNELLHSRALAEKYRDGMCALLRLAPVDYHRFHFIDDGEVEATCYYSGSYYSVNPIALRHVNAVYPKNARAVTLQHSAHMGDILYVEVGAASVGSITELPLNKPPKRGDEKGYFSFGGSTILLFFPKGTVRFDDDLLNMTNKGKETLVRAGEKIGEIMY